MNKFLKILIVTSLLWSGSLISATITVNTTDGVQGVFTDDGLCTFKEAVTAANTNFSSGPVVGECMAGDPHPAIDVIEFDIAILPAIILHATTFELLESVEIRGPSQDLLSLAGIGVFNRGFKIANTDANASFKISDMTISDHGILFPFDQYGAGILATLSVADLTLERVKFHNNTSNIGGGALALFGGHTNNTTIEACTFQGNKIITSNSGDGTEVAGGAAIFIGGSQTVDIKNSVFYDNIVDVPTSPDGPLDDASGGAILMLSSASTAVSELIINRSTFSNNDSIGVGGAIAIGGPGFPADYSQVTIRHTTVTQNSADTNNNQTGNEGAGGGIYTSAIQPVTIFNTLVASNTDLSATPRPDMVGSFNSLGYNLVGDNSGVVLQFLAGQPNVNNDTVGTSVAPIDPNLESLADNGGPTLSHELKFDSPALDQGKCSNSPYDQRYYEDDTTLLRPFSIVGIVDLNDGCDIGAFERYDFDSSSNPIPVAVDDQYSLFEDEILIIPAINNNYASNDMSSAGFILGVLDNDVDDNQLIISDAGSFVINSNAVQGSVDLLADGGFQFTPDADSFGVVTFEYTVTDLFNGDMGVATLVVGPVNDAPTFDVITDTIIASTGVPHTVVTWATEISSGPINESVQTLDFIVQIVPGSEGFFSQLPTVNSLNGNLDFIISPTSIGLGKVNIALRDSGGTQNGGINTSDVVTLTVKVAGIIFVNDFE
jgi:hypothetical protein